MIEEVEKEFKDLSRPLGNMIRYGIGWSMNEHLALGELSNV